MPGCQRAGGYFPVACQRERARPPSTPGNAIRLGARAARHRRVSRGEEAEEAAAPRRRRQTSEIKDEEEQVLRAATRFLVQEHGLFLVATDARKLSIRGIPVWAIRVTLRYDKGHEGYLGDLLYDGEQFTFLTEQSVIDERARKVAEDREGLRKWNAYRASTLHPGEA